MLENKNVLLLAASLENGIIDKSVIDVSISLKSSGYNVTVISAGGKMVKELKKENIEHILMPVNSTDFFIVRRNMKVVLKLAQEKAISLLHIFNPKFAIYGYKIYKALNIPYITSFSKIYKKSLWSFMKRKNNYLKKSQLIITPSDYMASYVQINYGIASEKITIIPQWVDTDAFNHHSVSAERIISVASDLRIPEDHFIITTIGKLEKAKGQLLLIQAIAKMQTSLMKKIRLIIVGSFKDKKKYKSDLEKLITKLNVERYVHIAGDVTDTAALLMLSDVYVEANIEPQASSINMLEAQCLGRPIIASNIGAAREYILDEETAKMFDTKNIDELVNAIVWSMNISEEERTLISQKLSTNARLNFSKNNLPQRIVNIYKYILNNK